jgi:prepilin-type N-terminal cleavage/methylation domain-containing protein
MKPVVRLSGGFTLLEVVVAVACAALLLSGAYAAIGGNLRNSDKAASVMNAALLAASVSDAVIAGLLPANQRSTSDSRSPQPWTAVPTPISSENETSIRQMVIEVSSATRNDRPLVSTSIALRGAPDS